jgi:O-succinylbenzoic acid--CoA ligase
MNLTGFISEGSKGRIVIDGHAVRWPEFLAASEKRAASWRDHGVNEKSVIIVPSRRGREFFVSLLAGWMLSATVVPVDRRVDAEKFSLYIDALGGGQNISYENLESEIFFNNEKLENTQVVLFTSGTSGAPKGVKHSLSSILGNASATIKKLDLDKEDKLFINTPFHFTSAICHFLAALGSGASFEAIENKLFPKDLCSAFFASGANCFGGAPIQLRWLAEFLENGSHPLKFLMSSGDNLLENTAESIVRKAPGVVVHSAYGLTEIGGRGCINRFDSNSTSFRGVGKPIAGLGITIYDEGLQPVARGELGQVFYSGEYLLQGFLDPVQGQKSIYPDRGYATGDIGFLDEQGCLYLQGRIDDVFKVSGQKVSSMKIQSAIMELKEIADCAVVAEPDPVIGNIPVAAIQFKPGEDLRKADIIGGLRQKLEVNHIPKKFYRCDSIPRTGSGKVKRGDLIASLRGMNSM